MISIINYISAKNRLYESDKTIRMLGTDCSSQILAQNDMIRFERDYYRDEAILFCIRFVGVITFLIVIQAIVFIFNLI